MRDVCGALLMGLCGLLAACAGASDPLPATLSITQVPTVDTQQAELAGQTPTAVLLTTTVAVAAGEMIQPARQEEESEALSTAEPQTATPAVCSPLAGLPLAWLPEIVSQPFSPPRPGRDDGHPGLDLAFYNWRGYSDIQEWPVQAVLAGRVSLVAEDRPPFGNLVLVETPARLAPPAVVEGLPLAPGQSVYSLYAHLAAPSPLQPGDPIVCGEGLGFVGNTGFSGAAHLHLEIRIGEPGAALPGMGYYDTRTTAEERETYQRWRMSGEFVPIDPLAILLDAAPPADLTAATPDP